MQKKIKIKLNEYRIIKGSQVYVSIYETSKQVNKKNRDVFHLKNKISQKDEKIKNFRRLYKKILLLWI